MANFTKFFRNGKTFSAFCRMRYGQSKKVWDDTTLWQKSGAYAIGFDLEAADAKFGGSDATMKVTPTESEPVEDDAAYKYSGCESSYWDDRNAGYCN